MTDDLADETRRAKILEKIKGQIRNKPQTKLETIRDGIMEFLELLIKVDPGIKGYKYDIDDPKIIIEIYRKKGADKLDK